MFLWSSLIQAKKFEKTEVDLQTEHYFGTKYSVKDVPQEWVEKWEQCELVSELYLPEPNPFIPDNSPPDQRKCLHEQSEF